MPPRMGDAYSAVELATNRWAGVRTRVQGDVQTREEKQVPVGWGCGCRDGRVPCELCKHAYRRVTVAVKGIGLLDLPQQQCPAFLSEARA